MDARNPDEIVVAGLAPNKRRNSPFDSNHRGNSLILLIDLAILGYLAYLLADAGVQMFNSYLVNGVLFLVIAGFYSIWFGYRTRKKWAYWPAVGILILVTILFLMFAAFNLWFILQGDLSGFFVVIFISFAVFSTIRRIMQHFHPMYIAAYLDRGVKIQGFDVKSKILTSKLKILSSKCKMLTSKSMILTSTCKILSSNPVILTSKSWIFDVKIIDFDIKIQAFEIKTIYFDVKLLDFDVKVHDFDVNFSHVFRYILNGWKLKIPAPL